VRVAQATAAGLVPLPDARVDHCDRVGGRVCMPTLSCEPFAYALLATPDRTRGKPRKKGPVPRARIELATHGSSVMSPAIREIAPEDERDDTWL
jgi:hypothetical protein